MVGEVGILNVGAGDTKLVFDPSDPEEAKKSARIVKDMIRRGFVLLVEIGKNDKGPIYQRAHDFDEETHEYIIAGMASDAEEAHEEKSQGTQKKPRAASGRRTSRTTKRKVAASSTTAVSVARTAGG